MLVNMHAHCYKLLTRSLLLLIDFPITNIIIVIVINILIVIVN